MPDPISAERGVYFYSLGASIEYIGRSLDPFGKRINQGYGSIHPKNCYIDGQATNCHLNSQISSTWDRIELWLCPIDSRDEIKAVEVRLIETYKPNWNIALK